MSESNPPPPRHIASVICLTTLTTTVIWVFAFFEMTPSNPDAFENFKQTHARIKKLLDAEDKTSESSTYTQLPDGSIVPASSNLLREIRNHRPPLKLGPVERIIKIDEQKSELKWRFRHPNLHHDKPHRWSPVEMPWDPQRALREPAT